MEPARRYNRRHTQERIAERADVAVTYDQLRGAVRRCQRENIPPLQRQTCSRSLYRVEVSGEVFFVVWSKRHQTVVTILTRDMAERRVGHPL